ncbi:SDR family NAD(P)-dependent oxidoreductase [Acidisphaera sp. L21]|uniref:SDR family NAD(P)-dependent oxidoreductase n=1 Tax=Acidisphaera sp. L21 TaxID=1641851 RepID=UPI00131A89D0|nr:SDR family oxidoreductase [Acidisphaera sp. L21]
MPTEPNRAQPLAGQVALVTGAQQGIGRAIAVEYAAAGADVAINYLDDQGAAEAVAAEIRALGRRAVLLQGDVSVVAQAGAMVAQAAEQLGRLDVLVNNAGVYPRVPMLEMRESDWDYVLDVNLKGTFFCSQAAGRVMVATGTHGAIISLTSRSIGGAVRGTHYSASKGGLVSLTRAMALELAPHRIRVNAIAPGLTDTAQPRYGMSEGEIAAASETMPLGRMAMPHDIAQTATFLASSASSLMTGQILHVNSGSYMP